MSDREASDWVVRFAHRIPTGGTVLDLACGGGRHTRLLRELGHPVVAVDRDVTGLGALAQDAAVRAVQADLESGGAWPLGGETFAGIVVTNYLWRPLFPSILESLEPEGLLIYETFAEGHERFGRPRNPEFLLREGELLEVFGAELRVLAYEHGEVAEPRPRVVQRICARRTRVTTREQPHPSA